jgi:Tripartite tricarboxylate transporter family receptor
VSGARTQRSCRAGRSLRSPARRARVDDPAEHRCDPADGTRRPAARDRRHVAQAFAEHARPANRVRIRHCGLRGHFLVRLLAPAGTPAPIVGKLYQEASKVSALSDTRERFAQLGLDSVGNSPDDFAAIIKADTVKWAKVIKEAGIKASE